MDSLSSLLAQFPVSEPEIRSLYLRDEKFRTACEDYEVAMTAMRYWWFDKKDAVRAGEYHQLAEEIASEIVAHFEAAPAPKSDKT